MNPLFQLLTAVALSLSSQAYSETCEDYLLRIKTLSLPDSTGERLKEPNAAAPLMDALRLPSHTELSRKTARFASKLPRISDSDVKALWYPDQACPSPVIADYTALKRLLNTDTTPEVRRKALALTLDFVKAGAARPGTILEQMTYLSLLEKATSDPTVGGAESVRKELASLVKEAKKIREDLQNDTLETYPANPEEYDGLTEKRRETLRGMLVKEVTLSETLRKKIARVAQQFRVGSP